jgi:hypothetical protein
MKLIIQDNIGNISVLNEIAISTNEMKKVAELLESFGIDIDAVQRRMRQMHCTCHRNFEGALIKIDPNCPFVQIAHD